MKTFHIQIAALLLLLVACGTPADNSGEVAEETVSTDISADSTLPDEPVSTGSNMMLPFPERSKIQLILEGEYQSGLGSINGKPFDTIVGTEAIHLQFGDKRLYSSREPYTYYFYKHNKHYPKLLKLSDDHYLYLLEVNSGDPSEEDYVEGWFFSSTRFIKRVDLRAQWKPDMSRDYSEEELWQIISRIPFSE